MYSSTSSLECVNDVILFGEVTPTLVRAEREEITIHADVVEGGKVFGVADHAR